MEYNREFLEDLFSYVQSTYDTLEQVADGILSYQLKTKKDIDDKVKSIFEDYINIVKLIDFCKENDNFFVHDTTNSLEVLKQTMEVFSSGDLVLLYDFLYYAIANEFVMFIQALESRLELG